MTTEHTDIDEYRALLTESDDINNDTPLKGTPPEVTVGTLLDCAEQFETHNIIIASRTNTPTPIGATFTAESLEELIELFNTLGVTPNIEYIEHKDVASIGYHFD